MSAARTAIKQFARLTFCSQRPNPIAQCDGAACHSSAGLSSAKQRAFPLEQLPGNMLQLKSLPLLS